MTAYRKSFLALLVLSAVFMSGCSTIIGSVIKSIRTVKINMYPELPAEQTTLITISEALYVYAYNGIDVSKKWYSRGSKDHVVKATVPAGETALSLNVDTMFRIGDTLYTVDVKDIEVRYNFEAGKQYSIEVNLQKAEESTFWHPRSNVNLEIKGKDSSTASRKSILKSWTIGKF